MGDNRYIFRRTTYTEAWVKAKTEEEAREKLENGDIRSKITGCDEDIKNAKLIEVKENVYKW